MAGAMRERFVSVAKDMLDSHPDLVLLTADLTAEMLRSAQDQHPERVINVGIREQLLISMAGGLALAGLRPVAHSFAPFLIERPFEQIKLDLCHQGVGAVLVSAGASYDISSGGRTHQSPGDVALLDTLPGWTVCLPGHPDEAEAQLRWAVGETKGLVYIRLSSENNRQACRSAEQPGFLVEREGTLGTIIAVGTLRDAVTEAVADLDVTVLYATMIRPFDEATLQKAVASQREAAVVVVEPLLTGTSVSAAAKALADVPHRVVGLGVSHEELRRYGTSRQQAIAQGLDSAGIRRRVKSFLHV